MGVIMVFINIGAVANGFSVFLPYVIEEHGFSYTQGSNLITIRCFFSFVAMLVVDRYYKFFSLRTGSSIATFLTCVGFAIYAASDTYLMFCIGAALCGFAFSFGAMIAVSLLMGNWFEENKATAIGICAAGSGIATILLAPVTTLLVEGISLSAAFGIESLGFFICTVLMFLVIRDAPRGKEMPDAHVIAGNADIDIKERNVSEKQIQVSALERADSGISRDVLVFMVCASLLTGMTANTGVTHLAALYTADGYEPMMTAFLVSLMGIVLTVGKIAYGVLVDKMGGLGSTLIFTVILVLGHVLCVLSYTQNAVLGVSSAVLAGLGWPIGIMGPSVWAGDLARPEGYARALQIFQLGYSAGAMLFAGVPGIMADLAGGTYNSAYALMGVMLTVFACLMITAYKRQRRSAGINSASP